MRDPSEEPPQGSADIQEKLLLTTREVAYVLSLSRTAVTQLIRSKQLFSIKVGGARRIPTFAVHDFVDAAVARGE